MERKKKILFIYNTLTTFVKKDIEILSENFLVTKYQFKPVKGILSIVLELIKQFFFLLINISKYNFIFIWFADTHSFLPVLFGKLLGYKSAIVIGGFDATSIPYLNYGLYCSNKPRQFFGKYSIRNATVLLPVDGSLIENRNYYASEDGKGLPVGIKNFVTNIKGNIITVPTGYDTNFWKANPKIKRENSVVTVANIPDWTRWKLKGCDFIRDIANQMPTTEFHIYGLTTEYLNEVKKSKLPQNLILHTKVENERLRDIYSKHKVYVQFSLSEGLPNVLCEAMLCGCIPVGSNVNGIPQAIGETGFILKHQDLYEALKILHKSLDFQTENKNDMRKRIISNYTIEIRKVKIKTILT